MSTPCPQVSGIAFFSVETAEHLLATHVSPPLDGCTYMGLDSGAQPVQVMGAGVWVPDCGAHSTLAVWLGGSVPTPLWIPLITVSYHPRPAVSLL